jgi:RNA recognition motif-containing protein
MTLYISNLDYSVTDEQLKNMFAPFGEVNSAKIIIDNFNGNSRGFGFVEMTDDTHAQKAIESINGKETNGRSVSVEQAKPKPERKGSYPARKKI